MIDDLERYKRVCIAMDGYVTRMAESFRLFIQLSIATVGGFIWLKLQPGADKAAADVFPLVRWILPILAIFTIIQLCSDLYGWFGYRRTEAELLGRPDLNPKFPKSGRLEILRAAGAIVIGVGGFIFLR